MNKVLREQTIRLLEVADCPNDGACENGVIAVRGNQVCNWCRERDNLIEALKFEENFDKYLCGEVVVTTDPNTAECLAVTRQDDEGQILSVIWEKPTPEKAYETRVEAAAVNAALSAAFSLKETPNDHDSQTQVSEDDDYSNLRTGSVAGDASANENTDSSDPKVTWQYSPNFVAAEENSTAALLEALRLVTEWHIQKPAGSWAVAPTQIIHNLCQVIIEKAKAK